MSATPRAIDRAEARAWVDEAIDAAVTAKAVREMHQWNAEVAFAKAARLCQTRDGSGGRTFRHGTAYAYQEKGCRCEPCTAVYKAKTASQRAARNERRREARRMS